MFRSGDDATRRGPGGSSWSSARASLGPFPTVRLKTVAVPVPAHAEWEKVQLQERQRRSPRCGDRSNRSTFRFVAGRKAIDRYASGVKCYPPRRTSFTVLPPFANTSNGLMWVGERVPRSKVELDTSVLTRRACSCGFFAPYEETAVRTSSRICSPADSCAWLATSCPFHHCSNSPTLLLELRRFRVPEFLRDLIARPILVHPIEPGSDFKAFP
jgi:hypothetical protein